MIAYAVSYIIIAEIRLLMIYILTAILKSFTFGFLFDRVCSLVSIFLWLMVNNHFIGWCVYLITTDEQAQTIDGKHLRFSIGYGSLQSSRKYNYNFNTLIIFQQFYVNYFEYLIV